MTLPRTVAVSNVAPLGVSVIVCCHNSAARLPPTLSHLAAQIVESDLPWEVIVVDNASTDETATTARACWPATSASPLRVVQEPRLGLSHARDRGRREARYEYLSFIDDDNWVSPKWVSTVRAVFSEHPDVGLCGGRNVPVFETAAPWWFDAFKHYFAVGAQAPSTGRMSFYLWGAGLSVRKSALEELIANGFEQCLTDRLGTALLSGGDSEISAALQLVGWHQWYDERLELQHFVPQNRLRWEYVRRVVRGSGISSVLLLPYASALRAAKPTLSARIRQSWPWLVQAALRQLVQSTPAALRMLRTANEVSHEQLQVEWRIGRIIGLVRHASGYRRMSRAVDQAKWARSVHRAGKQT